MLQRRRNRSRNNESDKHCTSGRRARFRCLASTARTRYKSNCRKRNDIERRAGDITEPGDDLLHELDPRRARRSKRLKMRDERVESR